LTGDNNPLVHIGSYTKNTWADIINIYRGRVSCLLDKNELMKISECKGVTENRIYKAQKKNIKEGLGEGVISAFPRMIIDYYDVDYLEKLIHGRTVEYIGCDKRS